MHIFHYFHDCKQTICPTLCVCFCGFGTTMWSLCFLWPSLCVDEGIRENWSRERPFEASGPSSLSFAGHHYWEEREIIRLRSYNEKNYNGFCQQKVREAGILNTGLRSKIYIFYIFIGIYAEEKIYFTYIFVFIQKKMCILVFMQKKI